MPWPNSDARVTPILPGEAATVSLHLDLENGYGPVAEENNPQQMRTVRISIKGEIGYLLAEEDRCVFIVPAR